MSLPTLNIHKQNLPKELHFSLPGDKSISHRSVIAACLARGDTKIFGLQRGEDCLATIEIFTELGCDIDLSHPDFVLVRSRGWESFDKNLDFNFNAKNSGTTARLLMGLFACIPGLRTTLSGDESLSKRPMDRVVTLLQNIGADIQYLGIKGFLPLTISGKKLEPGSHQFGRASAQVKSAVMFASTSGAKQTITMPAGARDHTEKLLPYLGFEIDVKKDKTETVSAVLQKPVHVLGEYQVPSDPSAMIFWLIALPSLPPYTKMHFRNVLKNPTRTQYLKVLKQLGFTVEWSNTAVKFGESRGDLQFTYHNQTLLSEISVDGKWCIDEVPALAAVATVAKKALSFRNVEELRIKESNRLDKTIELVRLFGAKAVYQDQHLKVSGQSLIKPKAEFASLGDHRLVMSYIMLCFSANSKNKVDSLGAHKVSYPHFLFELKKLGVTID